MDTVNKIFSGLLGFLLVATIGAIVYVNISPSGSENLTEFYILGPEGKAEGYPIELNVGEQHSLMVTIINREHITMSYQVEVRIDGKKINEMGPVLLDNDTRWEGQISLIPDVAGENQKLEFLLFKEDEVQHSYLLYLLLNVRE